MITISKALKYRKRVESAIARVSSDIHRYNSIVQNSDHPVEREVDILGLMQRRKDLVEHLISLNTRLHAANLSVYGKIIKLRELKGFITFAQQIPIDHGPRHVYGDEGTVEDIAVIRKTERDEMIQQAEHEIDTLQDELDEFNAVTKIDVPNFGSIL